MKTDKALPCSKFRIAERADDQQRLVAHGRREKLQQVDRRRVCDVKVFEDDDQRQALRCIGQRVADRVHEDEACLFGSEIRVFVCGLGGRKLGQNLRKGAEVGIELPRLGGTQNSAQNLDPRPICRRTAGFPAPTPVRAHPARACEVGDLLGEPALADARLPRQVPDRAAPLRRILDGSSETADLVFASDDGC